MACTSNMYIRVFPNNSYDDDVASDMASSLRNWCDFITSNLAPTGYDVDVVYDHPNLNTGNHRDTFYSNFRDWFYNNRDSSYTYGSHIGVSNDFGGGKAQSGTGSSNPFSDNKVGVAGDNLGSSKWRYITSIHEAGHNFTAYDIDRVQQYTYNNDDHTLGKARDGTEYTIMAYDEAHSESGSCSHTLYEENYGRYTTGCFNNAVHYTCKDAGGCGSNSYCDDGDDGGDDCCPCLLIFCCC